MSMNSANNVRAFLYGLTGAGLFRRLDYPGAPREFVDSRSLEEIRTSGEFERTCLNYMGAKQRYDAQRRRIAEAAAEEAKTAHVG